MPPSSDNVSEPSVSPLPNDGARIIEEHVATEPIPLPPSEPKVPLVEHRETMPAETLSPEGVVIEEPKFEAPLPQPGEETAEAALTREGIMLEDAPATGVRDPLYAARVLESQQSIPVSPVPIPSIRNRITPERVARPSVIRTFEGDVARAMKKDKLSLAGIVLAEERKRARTQEVIQGDRKQFRWILMGLGGLVVMGTLLWGFAAFRGVPSSGPTVFVPPQPLVFVESDGQILLTKSGRVPTTDALKTAVAQAQGKIDSMNRILLVREFPAASGGVTKEALSATELLGVLESRAPETFRSSLKPQFLFGVYQFDTPLPFLLLQTTTFESTFAGLLAWELDGMAEELLGIFNRLPLPVDTSAEAPSDLLSQPFIDFVIKNRDVRAFLGPNGTPLLFYTFIDRETILIATGEATLDEVVRRYYRRAP